MKIEHFDAIEALKILADDVLRYRYIKKKTRELILQKISFVDADPEDTWDKINTKLAKLPDVDFCNNISIRVGEYVVYFYDRSVNFQFAPSSHKLISFNAYLNGDSRNSHIYISSKRIIPKSLEEAEVVYENL